jgi:hypothetical protein
MRFLLASSILASILISGRIAAEAGPMETAPPPAAAPTIVNVQPRARDFNSHYAVNRAEQKRLSRFDARQRKLDKRRMTVRATAAADLRRSHAAPRRLTDVR